MPLVAASLGFAITPSSAIALRIVGAAAGGLAGFVAKNMILEKMKLAEGSGGDDDNNSGGGSAVMVSPSVLLALETIKMGPPISSMGLKKLEQIARKCKVSNEDLGEFFAQVFSEVVIDAVLEDNADLTELSDIIEFAETVGLSPAEVGDGFSIAAGRLGSQLGKDERGFFSSRRPQGMLIQAAKMFFLADKMLGTTDGFYGKRLAVSLSFFTNEEFTNVITDACTDLFKRCIEGTYARFFTHLIPFVKTKTVFLLASSMHLTSTVILMSTYHFDDVCRILEGVESHLCVSYLTAYLHSNTASNVTLSSISVRDPCHYYQVLSPPPMTLLLRLSVL